MSRIYQIMSENFKEIEKFYNDIPKGKGVRAKLILAINSEAEILASSVESLHLASLMHDDIIDEADMRRGQESINSKYGDKYAVMIGDIMYSKALFELAKVDSKVLEMVANAIYLLSLGELEDVELANNFNSDEKLYLDMIYKKTSALIEAGCMASAYLKGYNVDDFQVYGKNLGVAFQIVDDILDITQDSETLGKPAMNDFREGKVTLPYIYLYHSLDDEKREILKSYFKKELNEEEINWIKKEMNSHKTIQKSYELAKKLAFEGLEAIKKYDIKELEEILQKILNRSF